MGSSGVIYLIKYHPRVKDLVFVSTNAGLYRSDDNMETFERQYFPSIIGDIEFHPTDNQMMYIYNNDYSGTSKNNILISTDQGITFIKSADIEGNLDARGYLAVTPQAPNYVYFASTNGVWKSADQGQNFELLSIPEGSCLGFSVSDLDTLHMIYGYLDLYGSKDGGMNFKQITEWNSFSPSTNYVHADLRTSECINGVFYVGTDGYLAKSTDNGTTWTRLNTGTGIREFYATGLSQSNDMVYISGSQDIGTSILTKDGWIEWNGGDGMAAFVHPLNPDWMIGSWQYGRRNMTKDRGLTRLELSKVDETQNGAWEAPLFFDPNHNMRVYSFGEKVWRSEEFGSDWIERGSPGIGVIDVAEIAQNNSNIIAITKRDILKISHDGGVTFDPPIVGLPNLFIKGLGFDPQRDSTLVVTFNTLNNDGKKVYITHDLGLTWTNISYNLQDMPIRTVAIDHTADHNIYLGGEIGVFVKPMNGTHWESYIEGLPTATIKDLEIQYATNTITAASWGRGLWKVPLKGRADYPAIVETHISNTPSILDPSAGMDQYITSVISYNGSLAHVFVKWSNDNIGLDKTIEMINVSDSTWVSEDPFTAYGQGTEMYFKVFAVGEKKDTTQTYRFNYMVRSGEVITGVGDVHFDNEVTLFPNPNLGRFTIDLGKDYTDASIYIYDAVGKMIHQQISSGRVFDFNLNIHSGVYFLSVIDGDDKSKFRFIIE